MNFPLILLILTVVTGIFWVLERRSFLPARKARAEEAARRFEADNREAIDRGEKAVIDARNDLYAREIRQPWWLEYTAGLFPVIAIVFFVRSFLFEPFRIPSGSMLPTLQSGDFIAVNKYEYGIRFPVLNTKLTEGTKPKAGDVIVFDHPMQPGTDLIKRVVGVPGDKVVYRNKILYINGVEQPQKPIGDYVDQEFMVTLNERQETLQGHVHRMLVDPRAPDATTPMEAQTHPGRIHYTDTGFETTVPAGHYFVMGDNRDNSDDSRYWGFVPEENIVGRAFFIWLNIFHMSRVGHFE